MAASAKNATTIAQSVKSEAKAEIQAAAETAKDGDMTSAKGPNATTTKAKDPAALSRDNSAPTHFKGKADVSNQIQPVLVNVSVIVLERKLKDIGMMINLGRHCVKNHLKLSIEGEPNPSESTSALSGELNNKSTSPVDDLDEGDKAAREEVATPVYEQDTLSAAALMNQVQNKKTWDGLVAPKLQKVLELPDNGFAPPSPGQIAVLAPARRNSSVLLHGPHESGKTFGLIIAALNVACEGQQRSKRNSTAVELPISRRSADPTSAEYIKIFKPTVLWVTSSKTRTAQIHDIMVYFLSELDIDLQCCCEGFEYPKYALKQIDIMIGTVGRLWEMICETHTMQFHNLEVFIMDEAWSVCGPSLSRDAKVLAILENVALTNSMHRDLVINKTTKRRSRRVTSTTTVNTKAIISTPYWTEEWLREMRTILTEHLQRGAVTGVFWELE